MSELYEFDLQTNLDANLDNARVQLSACLSFLTDAMLAH